jgi:hypothetical protein
MLRLNTAPTSRLLHIQTVLAIEKLPRKPSVLCSGEVPFDSGLSRLGIAVALLALCMVLKAMPGSAAPPATSQRLSGSKRSSAVPAMSPRHTNAELIGQMERAARLSDRSLQSW